MSSTKIISIERFDTIAENMVYSIRKMHIQLGNVMFLVKYSILLWNY